MEDFWGVPRQDTSFRGKPRGGKPLEIDLRKMNRWTDTQQSSEGTLQGDEWQNRRSEKDKSGEIREAKLDQTRLKYFGKFRKKHWKPTADCSQSWIIKSLSQRFGGFASNGRGFGLGFSYFGTVISRNRGTPTRVIASGGRGHANVPSLLVSDPVDGGWKSRQNPELLLQWRWSGWELFVRVYGGWIIARGGNLNFLRRQGSIETLGWEKTGKGFGGLKSIELFIN